MSDEWSNQQNKTPDTSEPSPERQSELETAYEAKKGSFAPYTRVKIRTLGELQWIIQRRKWSSEWPHKGMSRVNLSGADLRHVVLRGADLSRAALRSADLRDADLKDAVLMDAGLKDAILRDADLRDTILSNANLSYAYLSRTALNGANLRNSHLSRADLRDSDLQDSDLTNATIGWTTMSNIDLRLIKGLVTIQHEGPSSIATDVFYRSHGEIPDIFLRGCGVPDEMISFVHSIAGAIQYYSTFISYVRREVAYPIVRRTRPNLMFHHQYSRRKCS
jgi:Pentapeptide repeats (8 copies)